MLLDDIIELLSSPSGSLSEALLKTKVLLHQIGKKDLVGWVNNELNGYSDGKVPEYRIVSAEVKANFANGAWSYTAHPIPLAHLSDTLREGLTSTSVKNSVAVIEQDVTGKAEGKLVCPIPVEASAELSRGLANGLVVQSAWCELNMPQVRNILVQVRSRLLDFLLELKDTIGPVSKPEELATRAQSVDATKLFNATIYGDHNTVVVGESNTQSVVTGIQPGDLAALMSAMADVGVQPEDLIELGGAIDRDRLRAIHGMEGKTGEWYTNLLGRALKGAAGVSREVVSGVVAKLLEAFMGIPS
jgi:hypothetical protein